VYTCVREGAKLGHVDECANIRDIIHQAMETFGEICPGATFVIKDLWLQWRLELEIKMEACRMFAKFDRLLDS
jgi:hypothetical protein